MKNSWLNTDELEKSWYKRQTQYHGKQLLLTSHICSCNMRRSFSMSSAIYSNHNRLSSATQLFPAIQF